MNVLPPSDETEFRAALALLMAQPDRPSADVGHRIDLLTRYADRYQLSLKHCLIAKEGEQIIAACLCVDSAGRSSSVLTPALAPVSASGPAVVRLLEEASRLARGRAVLFLQGMIPPEAVHQAELYRQASFAPLARLIYLETDLAQPVLSGKSTPPVTWETYSPRTHDLFARVVEGTYEQSLDCPRLNSLRDIEDVLASHRATGEFDPDFWLVAVADSEPAGTLLLSHTPERSSYEVVYMGLLPGWRGRGYGGALLRRAVELAREQAAAVLTLAVDARNTPARRLYRRFGFREVCRRDAWIRVLPGPGLDAEHSRHGPA